jgi:hypothetical protein
MTLSVILIKISLTSASTFTTKAPGENMINVLLLVITLSVSTLSFAQVTSQTGTSSSQWDRIKEDFIFSHFSIFTGPGVRSGGSRKILANGQASDDPIAQWFQLTIGKKINDNITFAVNPRFTLYYGSREGERQAEIDDPVTGFIFNYKLSKNVSYFGIVNTVTGKVSRNANQQNLLLNPGDFHEVTYSFSPSFDMAIRTFFRGNIYSRNENLPAYGGWIGPKVEYYFSDKSSFRFWVEQSFAQEGSSSNFFSTDNKGQNLYFSWHEKVHKKLGILPYVAINSTESYSARNAFFGAWMYGSFF